MKVNALLIFLLSAICFSTQANDELQALKAELALLKKKIEALEALQEEAEQAKKSEPELVNTQQHTSKRDENGIKIGGAFRYQYTYSDFDQDNQDRAGDLDFNLFRLDFKGKIDDFSLSAQYRWYDYMNVVHHAWIAYDFNERNQLKFGIQEVPFGNFPKSANSFFYSTAYFVGIQADFDTGLNWTWQDKGYRLDLGFFPNDELGGVDGWVDDRKDRYSFDVLGLRLSGEGIFSEPEAQLGESNTFNLRLSKQFDLAERMNIEPGVSFQKGHLSQNGRWRDISGLGHKQNQVGNHASYAAHVNFDYHNLNAQFQYARYKYEVDGINAEQFAVGSFNFYGTIPASANAWLLNLSWEKPVNWGAITKIRLFNDYSQLTNKSGNFDKTWMNSTGVIVSAGPLYTYIEYYKAKNQPFIGGNLVGNDEIAKGRLNMNIGYYF
ncbi:porin [Agaribacter flavus]|uniref:Porin n=1 Tax=Agaribacter flavus TaxID=1902781 RepID=A0ABV7FR07_9ALTE